MASNKKRNGGRTTQPKPSTPRRLLRGFRAGPGDLAQRSTVFADLQDRSVLLIGLGNLGSTSAVQLGREGVGALSLVDFDYYDPATGVRHQLDLRAAGLPKTQALTEQIQWAAPHTAVETPQFRLGMARPNGEGPDTHDFLVDTIAATDLVYDATADRGVTSYLSDLALAADTPMISVATANGTLGGRIARFEPTGICSDCLDWYLIDQPDETSWPHLPSDPELALVQPAGCGELTFVGTGFEPAVIALGGVQAAIAVLSPAYPTADWNVAVVTMRDSDGSPIPGNTDNRRLPTHTSCSAAHKPS